MCEKIRVDKNSWAAVVSTHGLSASNFCKLNWALSTTFVHDLWMLNPKSVLNIWTQLLSSKEHIRRWHLQVWFSEGHADCLCGVKVQTWLSQTEVWMEPLGSFCVKITASSAYSWTSAFWHVSGRSFVHNVNRIGPNMEPWGTPTGHSQNVDLESLTPTLRVLLDKCDCVQWENAQKH